MRLIVDVMSGDEKAVEAIKGAIRANKELKVDITLVGKESVIREALSEIGEKISVIL